MDITHAGLNNVDFARNTMLQHKIKQIVNGQHFEIRKFYLMTVSIIAYCVYLCALASDLGSSKVLFDTRSPGHPQKPDHRDCDTSVTMGKSHCWPSFLVTQ